MDNKEEILQANFLNDKYKYELEISTNYKIKYELKYIDYNAVYGKRRISLYLYFEPKITMQKSYFNIFLGEKDIVNIPSDISFFNKRNFENLCESIIKNKSYTWEKIINPYDNYAMQHNRDEKNIYRNNMLYFLSFHNEYTMEITFFNKIKIVNYLK
jgi:hypothetical protein